MSTTIQLIITAIVSALAGLLSSFVNPYLAKFKYGALVGDLFSVADPVVKELLPTLGSNGIWQVLRLSAAAVTDGKLTDAEVNQLAAYALSIFDVQQAAAKGAVPVLDAAALSSSVDASVAAFREQQSALGIKPTVVTGASGLLGTKPAIAAIKPAT